MSANDTVQFHPAMDALRARFIDGHAVQAAATPQQLAPDSRRDLVLLGLQFGDDPAAGLQAIDALSQNGLGRAVVVSTSHRGLDQKLAAYRAGAEAVLIKPYGAEELRRAVACALNASALLSRVCVLTASTGAPPWPAHWHVIQAVAAMAQLVDEQACDAVVLTGPVSEASLSDLSWLVRDLAPALPVIWCVAEVTEAVLEAAALVGAASVLPQTLSVDQLQAVVDCHAVRSRAQARKDQHLRDSLYEINWQRLALDHHAAVSVANARGELVDTSAHHAQLRGCSMEALIGSHLCEERAGKAPPKLPVQAVEAARRGEVWQGRLSLTRSDGAPCWVEAMLIPFMDAQAQVYRFLLARTDVTRQVVSEQQLATLRQAEMDTASTIQSILLVPPLPAHSAACWVGTCFEAAAAVAGDFHGLRELAPGCVDVVIGDVMGKGVHAAMVGAAVKLELSRCVHSQRGEWVALPNDNPPLGILEGETYLESHHPLNPGASLLMYSDGLSETENAQGEALGEPPIEAAFHRLACAGAWPSQTAQGLLALTRQHRGKLPVGDDQTVVVVRVPETGELLLSVPADLTQMAGLRRALRDQAADSAPPEAIDRMELAMCEAFSNIVRHGVSAHGPADIHIGMGVTAQRMWVDLFDHTASFEPPTTLEPLGENPWAEGGMGLRLIQALCDVVEYGRSHGYNRCHLAVLLPSTASAAAP